MSWLYPIRFQWLEWALALTFLIQFARSKFNLKQTFDSLEVIPLLKRETLERTILFGYLFISIGCKYFQFLSLQLHAFDFWLFEDLLRHLAQGGGMLTRFAPQEPGLVQHGVIHGFWPMILLVPFVWVVGSFWVALIFNPVAVVGAGFLLVRLMRRLGLTQLDRLLILVTFLFCFTVTEMLMQEMHPELIYLGACFWIWELQLADKIRNKWVLPLLYFVMGTFKEDAVFLLLPFILFSRSKFVNFVALLSGGLIHAISMKLIAQGSIGLTEWNHLRVKIPQVTAWGTSGIAESGVLGTLGQIFIRTGGFMGWVQSWVQFMTYPSTILFLASCFFVLKEKRFWILWIPYSFIFAFLGEKARLTNYYAAPFTAVFFITVAIVFRSQTRFINFNRATLWMVTFLSGSSSLVAWIPMSPTPEIRRALSEIRLSDDRTLGVVAAPFLGIIDQQRVWSDRPPLRAEDWGQVRFLILPQGWANYEISMDQLKELELKLGADPTWKRQPTSSEYIQYWVRAQGT